ncbi:hypothetical protein ABH990_007515 [Bradyrhizobium ottawaense]
MLIAFKLKLALACAAGLAGPIAMAPLVSDMTVHGTASEPAIVRVAAGSLSYREAGDFTRGGQQAEAPLRAMRVDRPLHIMRNQVSSSDYQLCVQDGACRALDRDVAVAADRPAVQVSWHDAEAYAGWLSRKTGHHYRLPSDAEWAFAAGSRFKDDGVAVDADDPSKRWISRYERESERDLSDTTAYPFGKFGPNEHGRRRPRRQRLGMDLDLLRALARRRRRQCRPPHRELRRACRRGRPPRLCHRFHPRRPRRRLCPGRAARQSRLPPGTRGDLVGRQRVGALEQGVGGEVVGRA